MNTHGQNEDTRPEELAADAERTAKDASSTMYHIAIVGMIGSLIASGLTFFLLTGHYWAIAEGVGVAVTVDYGLLRWMRISARLRRAGAEPASGKVLDRAVAVMTIYLNGSAGLAPLVVPNSATAYVMITIAHLFIPIVMLMVFIAAPNAQLLLQAKAAAARKVADAERQAAIDADDARADGLRRERNKVDTAQAEARTAEANKTAKEAAAKTAEANASVEIRRSELAAAADSLRASYAILLTFSTRLMDRQAVEAGADRRARDRLRRQEQSTGRRQPVNRPSAGRVNSTRRQDGGSGSGADSAAKTPTVEELVAVARADLSTALSMGAPKLSAWLSERLDGAPVSRHKTDQVIAAIRPKNGGKNVIEFHTRAAGGER
jgi:hypothetical protein